MLVASLVGAMAYTVRHNAMPTYTTTGATAAAATNRATHTTAKHISMMARTPLIAGNWKMNTDLTEATKLAQAVAHAATDVAPKVNVAVCVPFPFLIPVKTALANSPVGLGAQDCHHETSGAFTGAVSTSMLESVGTDYVVTGHSERRAIFGDTDEDVNLKTLKVLAQGLKPILCIGELKEQRENGTTMDVCKKQLEQVVKMLDPEKVVIAYEPVWAIGTGLVATPEQAQDTQKQIREYIASAASADVAAKIRIQYGGSVNGKNCEELAALPDIDGFLVGGASLKPEFADIIKACSGK